MPELPDHEWVMVQPTKRDPSNRSKIATVLKANKILGVLGESYALLRPSAPSVEDRGWLEFLSYRWTYFSKPPHDYAVWKIDQASTPSWAALRFNIWLVGLTAGARYIAAIDVSASPYGNASPIYEIRSSDAAPAVTSAKGSRTLLVEIKPDSTGSLIYVEASGVDSVLFFQAEIFRMDV